MHEEHFPPMLERITALEGQLRRYRRLALIAGLLMLAAVGLAARTVPSDLPILRAARLDIVQPTGQTVVSAYATRRGGHLEVLDHEGHALFSVGLAPGLNLPGLWERQRRTVDQQQLDLIRLRQDLDRLSRQVRQLDRLGRTAQNQDRQQRVLERQQRDVEHQQRDIDRLQRQIDTLDRQVRSLERR